LWLPLLLTFVGFLLAFAFCQILYRRRRSFQ
jgi:hypothetical protein